MPGKVISFVNFKGGVGKTTVSVNVAACLASPGFNKRVLLIDLDPQSSASLWILTNREWEKTVNTNAYYQKTAAALFLPRLKTLFYRTPYKDKIKPHLPDFHLLPASFKMIRLEDDIFNDQAKKRLKGHYKPGDEYGYCLKYFPELRKRFDYVIVDCAPNLYKATVNSVVASDYLVIPCIPDDLSTTGLNMLLKRLAEILRRGESQGWLSNRPQLLGVVQTKKRGGVPESNYRLQDMIETLNQHRREGNPVVTDSSQVLTDHWFSETIKHSTAVREDMPVFLSHPNHQASQDVISVTRWIFERTEGGV